MEESILTDYLSLVHNDEVSTHKLSNLFVEFSNLNRLIDHSQEIRNALQLASSNSGKSAQIEKELSWNAKPGNEIIVYESEDYPDLLRKTDTPPPVIYVTGNKKLLRTNQLAIVGSRKATHYGRSHAFWLANEIAKVDISITSGMARGIDTEAHLGAMESGGNTIGIMGTGINKVYPKSNQRLADRIKNEGALLSEFPLDTPPYPANFPRRNRIISGLSLGALIVEATIKSGSLITARLAMEQNREVFALPGPVSSRLSQGCHHLLRQGAKLVETPVDILEELATASAQLELRHSMSDREKESIVRVGETSVFSKKQELLLSAMGDEQCLFDTLITRTGFSQTLLNRILFELEEKGQVVSSSGRYSRLF